MKNLEFYSHLEIGNRKIIDSKLLKNHLKDVRDKIATNIEKAPIKYKNILAEVGKVIGLCHDFGKYTTYFQEYLRGEKNHGSLSHHGFISALFGAYIIKEKLDKYNLEEELEVLPLISYFSILHHHGDLRDVNEDIVDETDLKSENFIDVFKPIKDELRNIPKQIENLLGNKEKIEREYGSMGLDIDINDFKENWLEVMVNLEEQSVFLIDEMEDEKISELFIFTLYLYSTLIESDKRDAAQVDIIDRKYMNIPSDIVDRDRIEVKKFDTSIKDIKTMNGIRNIVYENVMESVMNLDLEKKLLTITSPTGSGKTLTSLSAAIKLRQRIKNEKGYTPRIIYSLPFTSIIDQNYDVIEEILSQLKDFENNSSSYLLKHHHLADISYKEKNEKKPLDESLLLVEAWESEVIVTTFIQLLHTIIGFKNSFLKKYHNIAGSILVLDEVQNIPIKYWDIVGEALRLLSKHLNCYIILLTATKPLIFSGEESVELVGNNFREYFNELNRVRLHIDLEKKDINSFIEWFDSRMENDKSYLIVLNTIGCSVKVYNEIHEKLKNKQLKRKMYYLSSNIIPQKRLEIIEEIKKNMKQKPIVVATQMVEAGVDLDFDVVIRDIGPIDSIVQVAGRCNRSWSDKLGEVYLMSLKSDNGKSYGSWIYGAANLSAVKDMLDKKEYLEEKQFYDVIDQYFNNVYDIENKDPSEYIKNGMLNFRFHKEGHKESISQFKLIEDNLDIVDVFIEINDKARNILQSYIEEVLNEKDFQKRKINYLKIRKDFKSYVISVNRKYVKGLEPLTRKLNLYKVDHEDLKARYSKETGFYKDGWEEMTLCF